MNSKEKIKLLLDNSQEARESYRHLISMFRYQFNDTISDSAIEREARMLKRKFPKLRDSRWQERQKFSNNFRDKVRSQEKPEDLSEMFSKMNKEELESKCIHIEKETIVQFIFRKIFGYGKDN